MNLLAMWKLVEWSYLAAIAVAVVAFVALCFGIYKFLQRKSKKDKHGKRLKALDKRFAEQVDPMASTVATHEEHITHLRQRNEELAREAELSSERMREEIRAEYREEFGKQQEQIEKLQAELELIKAHTLAAKGLSVEPAAGESAEAEAIRAEIEIGHAEIVDHFTLGYEADLREDWPTALKHYEAALAEERTAAVLNNLGVVYEHFSRFTEAMKLYEEAEELRRKQGLPENSALAKNRGEVYRALGRYEEALGAFARAEELLREQGLPVDPSIAFNRAFVYKAQGDLATACKLACQARDMYTEHKLQAPVHPNILEFIERYCSKQDEQATEPGPGQGPAPTDNAE